MKFSRLGVAMATAAALALPAHAQPARSTATRKSARQARARLAAAGAEHDAVLSFEATRTNDDKLSLATSGIGAVAISVEGRASHAGTNRNVIPAHAKAEADVRVLRVADHDRIEATVRERAKKQLLPDAKVTVNFERRRPPLEATPVSRKLAAHAQAIYAEIGRKLKVDDQPEGGGTDAAFAALKTKAPVIERFGLPGFGAHSADSEWVDITAIEPRLYLAARVIMDVARGKAL